jgi:hypothetical protein
MHLFSRCPPRSYVPIVPSITKANMNRIDTSRRMGKEVIMVDTREGMFGI